MALRGNLQSSIYNDNFSAIKNIRPGNARSCVHLIELNEKRVDGTFKDTIIRKISTLRQNTVGVIWQSS